MRQEAESLLDRVVEESAEVPGDGGLSPSEAASAMLFELRALAVGEVAPEIEGEDLDGLPMRLSEERGKVVALVWWASWCGPCMEMVSHELEMIDRMKGRPFVLLGVNGDEDRGRMRHQMAERGITWRSWADGGPHGPISTRWNVRSWPTIYVIDPEGVIRYRGGRDAEALDRAVDSVLEEVEGSRGVVTVD